MPDWLRTLLTPEIVAAAPVIFGAVILFVAVMKLFLNEATGTVLIGLALVGFALLVSPKLERFAYGNVSIEFATATQAVTAKLTENVQKLATAVEALSRRQAELAAQVQKLAQGTPSAAAELAPIVDQSRQLSEALKANSASIGELQSLQRDLGNTVRSIQGK